MRIALACAVFLLLAPTAPSQTNNQYSSRSQKASKNMAISTATLGNYQPTTTSVPDPAPENLGGQSNPEPVDNNMPEAPAPRQHRDTQVHVLPVVSQNIAVKDLRLVAQEAFGCTKDNPEECTARKIALLKLREDARVARDENEQCSSDGRNPVDIVLACGANARFWQVLLNDMNQKEKAGQLQDGTYALPMNLSPPNVIPAPLFAYTSPSSPPTPATPSSPSAPPDPSAFDMSFIGGLEQAGLASKPSQTEGFLRLFVRSPSLRNTARLWGTVRLLGAPNTGSTQGVISAFTDPSGQIKTDTLSSVGASVDFMMGLEFSKSFNKDYVTHGIILGFGGTTPLTGNSVTQAFTVPAYGTAECNILWAKFASQLSPAPYNIQKGQGNLEAGDGDRYDPPINTCLINENSQISATSNGAIVTVHSPINTLAFSPQTRTNIFGKYVAGYRFIHRYTCVTGGRCSEGVVDITAGPDASITGGTFRKWIFKTDATYPLVINGSSILYLFGSFSMRFQRNQTDDPPLVLQAASLSALTATSGSAAVPNVNTVVLPLKQPNRDFYRFGIGLDVSCIFSKIFTAGGGCLNSTPDKH